MMKDYYVYIYYRLDTNEPFYVGKGRCKRWRVLSNRKGHFKNIMNKTDIACEIYKDNLTENEAHGIECWLIHEFVFEYGFSINIKGNNSSEKEMHLVNQTWGGEGTSGCAKNNKGINNPMYGKCHTNETRQKLSEKAKLRIGELNPFYGKHHSDETKEKIKGKNNPSSKSVICLTTKKIFFTLKEGAEYYKCNKNVISDCCRGARNTNGYRCYTAGKLSDGTKLTWRYLVWKHNKRYRIKQL